MSRSVPGSRSAVVSAAVATGALVTAAAERVRDLGLLSQRDRSRSEMVEFTVYITALSMTFLTGKRPLRHRKAP